MRPGSEASKVIFCGTLISPWAKDVRDGARISEQAILSGCANEDERDPQEHEMRQHTYAPFLSESLILRANRSREFAGFAPSL